MHTKTDLTELADHLPARRLGEVLRRARWNAGFSCAEVAAATGDLMPIRLVGSIERGRRRPTRTQLELLDMLYNADLATHLGTARVLPVIDLGSGLLELGSHRIHLLNTETRQVLSQYVDLISLVRGTRTGALRFRIEDVEVLGTSLARSRRSIQSDLRSLLRGDIAIESDLTTEADDDGRSNHHLITDLHHGDVEELDWEPIIAAALVPLATPMTMDGLIDTTTPVTTDPTSIDRLRLVELDAVRDAIYAPPSLRDHFLTKHTRTDRERALRTRQRELLGELGFPTWSSLLIAIAQADAIVPLREPEHMLALNPAPSDA